MVCKPPGCVPRLLFRRVPSTGFWTGHVKTGSSTYPRRRKRLSMRPRLLLGPLKDLLLTAVVLLLVASEHFRPVQPRPGGSVTGLRME